MKFFQMNRKIFAMLGISSSQSTAGLNVKTVIAFSMYSLGCTATGLFLCREAVTFSEITETIYICSAFAVIGLAFTSMKVQTKLLFTFFETFEDLFKISAYRSENLEMKFIKAKNISKHFRNEGSSNIEIEIRTIRSIGGKMG